MTTELFRTDYASFDVILLLKQNQSQEEARFAGQEGGGLIDSARFENAACAAVFDLEVKDDRTLLVVPRANAIGAPKTVASRYTSKVIVSIRGEEYTTDASLKLTVKKSTPKLKAASLTFNTFYTGQSQPIQITGGTVTTIAPNTAMDTAKTDALPAWLELVDGSLRMNGSGTPKSGKAYLMVDTAQWAVSTPLTVAVKAEYAAPKLKLSASSVKLSAVNSQGIRLKLLCVNKKETLEKLNVKDVSADGFDVSLDRQTGELTLKPTPAFTAGAKKVIVSFTDTNQTVSLKLTVAAKKPVLTVKPSSATLNSTAGDSIRLPVTASPADYGICVSGHVLTDKRGTPLEDQEQLTTAYENGILTVSTNEKTQPGTTYYLHIRTQDTSDAVITVKTLASSKSTVTVSAKASGAVDLPFPESAAVITPSFRNYASGRFTVESWNITAFAGKTPAGNANALFRLSENSGKLFLYAAQPEPNVKHTYYLDAALKLEGGTVLNISKVKVPVKHTAVKLKLSKTSLSLNPAINDFGDVTVTCQTKGYAFQAPTVTLTANGIADSDIDLSGPNPGSALDFDWHNGVLTISTNAGTEAGKTYRVLIRAAKNEPAVTLSVKTPAANKSAITAKLSAKGIVDTVRDGTAVVITPKFSGCAAPGRTQPTLTIEAAPNGKSPAYSDVTRLFSITPGEGGTFRIAKLPGAALDLSLKYRAKLTFTGGSPAYTGFRIKSGTAKTTVSGTPTLYRTDRFSQGTFRLSSEDGTLNPIDHVTFKDTRQAALFDIRTHGGGKFSVGFRDSTVQTKAKYPGCVSLNVFYEGNNSNTPNAVVTLKLTVR